MKYLLAMCFAVVAAAPLLVNGAPKNEFTPLAQMADKTKTAIVPCGVAVSVIEGGRAVYRG